MIDITKIIISDGLIKDEELYLWNKIAERMYQEKSELEIIKKEIFSKVINEYIRSERERINNLKNLLHDELKNSLNYELIDQVPQSKINSIVETVNNDPTIDFGFQHPFSPKIFFIGQMAQSKATIRNIFKKTMNNHKIKFNNKSFVFAVDKDYANIKRVNKTLIKNAVFGRYDFLVYGPHTHNLHGFGNLWQILLYNK